MIKRFITRISNKEGFSLVEIMIASGILALIFIGFMTSFLQATRLQFMADRNYAASVLARNRVETLKIYAYETLLTMTETVTQVDREGVYNATGTFWRTTFIADSANNTNCSEIIVQVWYETKPGITSDAPVEVRTMIGG